MTRQMRYSSNLDEDYFQKQLVAAAQGATQGDLELARDHLSKCFDVLGEERDHYYPVDAYLLDLSLVAPTTMGAGLRKELSRDIPVNLILPASVLARMAEQQPQSLAQLKEAIQGDQCTVVAGPATELPSPLLSCETILRQLQSGMKLVEKLLGQRLSIYGRQRFGLTAVLPQMLHKLGFAGALHATFDDGRFPDSSQSKTRWEGVDGSAIEVLARIPMDATRPETFLNLATKIGESMESDYVATVGLAHWAGQSSPWYADLQRCARYTSALGRLTTFTEFFQQTEHAGHLDRFEPDQYRSPYLKQAVGRDEHDPISRVVRYWHAWALLSARRALGTWLQLAGGVDLGPGVAEDEIDGLLEPAGDPSKTASDWGELVNRLESDLLIARTALARLIPNRQGAESPHYVITNSHSFVRRAGFEFTQSEGLPGQEEPVYAADQSSGRGQIVVDVPAAGFVCVSPGSFSSAEKKSADLAEENVLRNEFFEAKIDPHTGALRSLYDYHSRGNRMSQQLALRSPAKASGNVSGRGPEDSAYSMMAAESVEITAASAVLGEITSKGKLVDTAGRELARFVNRFRVWRGSRVLMLDIELEPLELPGSDPWQSYYASRFAWADESADLYRSVNMTRQATEAKRLEAPLLVEIDNGSTRTTILTMGLPYHRRIGLRKLDSLLIVRGETARRFRIGIGIDLKQSMPEALGTLAPPSLLRLDMPPPDLRSGWFFHIDSRSVVATFWEAIVQGDTGVQSDVGEPDAEKPRVVGFRVRLLETAGRSGRVTVSAFRRVATATEVDFQGKILTDCSVVDGNVQLDMSPYQWSQLEAIWEARHGQLTTDN